jgi:myo-inositol 2-dehydrogenase / D-chiro-inositol 1-dehydrogenase
MAESAPVSIGLIGAGGMGTRHVVNLHQHVPAARVSAVYDSDPARAHQAAALCGSARVFQDPAELIGSNGVQAVIVASPDATHADYVLACLRQGKPVLCEKPLAASAVDAARILQAEQDLGKRQVSVGFMRRFDPQHAAVRQAAAEGRLGRPILYKGVHRNASIPYSVSGAVVITNSAGHDLDAARWLLGQEVEEVFVRGVRSHASYPPDTLDLLLFQLQLANGCLAMIEVYVGAEYGYEVSAELVGEHGTALTLQPDLALLRANQSRSVSVPVDWLLRFQAAYVAEEAAWVRSLQTGEPFPGASAWDGYVTLLVSDACIRSLHTGLPVRTTIPETPALYRRAS